MLPNARLMARAFHRAPPKAHPSTSVTTTTTQSARRLSISSKSPKWEGRQPEEHVTRERDTNNVQHGASREGKQERAKGEGSRGTTEASGESNRRAKEEFPEAPDTVGMQDERGRNTKK